MLDGISISAVVLYYTKEYEESLLRATAYKMVNPFLQCYNVTAYFMENT